MSHSPSDLHAPASAEDLIQEIVQREVLEAAEESGPKRNRDQKLRPVLGVLLVLVAGLTVWNTLALRRSPSGLTAEEAHAYLRVMSATVAIEAFATQHRRLPSALSQVDIDPTGLAYERSGDTFTLSVVVDGKSVRFKKGEALSVLESGLQSLPGTTLP